MTPIELMIDRMKTANRAAVRVAPFLVAMFAVLTILDGLSIYKCGWFWTSVGAIFCAIAYSAGKDQDSLLRGNLAMLSLIIGFSAGITPFVAPYLLPHIT